MKYISNSIILLLLLLGACSPTTVQRPEPPATVYKTALNEFINDPAAGISFPYRTRVDTVVIDQDAREILVAFSPRITQMPFRQETVDMLYGHTARIFGDSFADYQFKIETAGFPVETLIPNYYRDGRDEYDTARLPKEKTTPVKPVVKNISKPASFASAMNGRHIALWHSHGWYYEHNEDRWMWQRPRMFQTVEDLLPMAITIPYLVPMLENAGAYVFIPRERDTQINEVVIDNDTPAGTQPGAYTESGQKNDSWKYGGTGFAIGEQPYPANYNPFAGGTARIAETAEKVTAEAWYQPAIPEEGEYAVYISYLMRDDAVPDARYTVYHTGGSTEFVVDQTMAGGTWVYLGSFPFAADSAAAQGVKLTNQSEYKGVISADAVRFGGGMGVVARNGKTSGRPKFVEGARYWLQYAGMPDTLVYNINGDTLDYVDDYQSRNEYVNYLKGAPFGPTGHRDTPGLNVPIELSLAFHTDAGITRNDRVIGTLMIYSLWGSDTLSVFPDSVSRFASRDLSDITQTTIVEDIRAKYDPEWSRRSLRNADYSEAYRPNVPAMLLELLSHQNWLDQQFIIDPRFRFFTGRSIYKGMLKFLAAQYDEPYIVQPLPVTHFRIEAEGAELQLSWRPQPDPLEPTADAESYIVYTKQGNGGFDNGIAVSDTNFTFAAEPGMVYHFKVTAVNGGGESFPSEQLSALLLPGSEPLLIVNGFDRVSGPEKVDGEIFAGFMNKLDMGVPDGYDINFTGSQYDYDPNSQFITNEWPGHGGSFGHMETEIIAGNTKNFPALHGAAFAALGRSFVSASDEAVEEGLVRLDDYPFVDFIYGEEKTIHWQRAWTDSVFGLQYRVFTKPMKAKIRSYAESGGAMFFSGAYLLTDLFDGSDSTAKAFADEVLKCRWTADHASLSGQVYSADGNFLPEEISIAFNQELRSDMYAVESPDALSPTEDAEALLYYKDTMFRAAAGYNGDHAVVVLGIPFESVTSSEARTMLMKAILSYTGQ